MTKTKAEPSMTPAQSELVARLRALLADRSPVREASMFGSRSFMVDERLAVAAMKDGGLLVRVPSERHDELIGRPGARQAEMGAGRTMGPSWLTVSAEVIGTDEGLAFWLGVALERLG